MTDYASQLLSWASTGVLVLLALRTLASAPHRSRRADWYRAAAVVTLAVQSTLSRVAYVFGWRSLLLQLIGTSLFLGSGLALLEYADLSLRTRSRLRSVAWGTCLTLVASTFFVRFPGGQNPKLGAGQWAVVLIMIGAWSVIVLHASWRLRAAAKRLPRAIRGRYEAMFRAYLSIVVLFTVAIALSQSREPAVRLGVQLTSLFICLPAMWVGFAPPAWLVRRWERRESDVARARLLLEHLPAIVWTTNEDLVITSSRGRGLTLLGLEQDEAAGRRLEDTVSDPEALQVALDAAKRALSGEEFEYDYEHEGRIWNTRMEPLRSGDGAVIGTIGMTIDITERKRHEVALAAALEMERRAAEQLRAVDEMKDSILSAVSHELRTPLAGLLGLLITYRTHHLAGTEMGESVIERAEANAERLTKLLLNLLDLDRIRRNVLEPQRHPTNLVRLVQEMLAMMDAEIELDVPEHGLVRNVDAAQVERIVENLVANATKHAGRDARIVVRLEPAGEGVLLTVTDDGPGIPDEQKDAIFEPFARGATTAKGTGVGLALVRRFAELHDGRAWVEDRPGGGSSFRVWLRAAATPAPFVIESARPAGEAVAPQPAQGPPAVTG